MLEVEIWLNNMQALAWPKNILLAAVWYILILLMTHPLTLSLAGKYVACVVC